MIQDLNTDNNSCAAWIAKFLISRKVELIFGFTRWTYTTYLGSLL